MLKQTTVLTAALIISACSGGEPEGSGEADAAAPAEEATTGAAIGPGLYAVGNETTEYARTRLNADGTYVDMAEGTEVGNGTWTSDGATMCFDPEGDGETEQERCWVNGPADADGSFTSTRDDGSESYRVTPISE